MPNLAENHTVTYFCHSCNFLLGLIGKPKLEIASFSHYTNIKGEQIFQSSQMRVTRIFFLPVQFYDGPWQTPPACQYLQSIPSVVAEILKGNRKILGSSPRPGPRPLFFCMGF